MNFKGAIGSATDVGGVPLDEFNKIDKNTLVNPTISKIVEFTSGIPDNLGYRYNLLFF